MEINKFVGASVLTAGLAAGLAAAPNLINVGANPNPPQGQMGTLNDAPGSGALQAGSAGDLNLNRLIDGAYELSFLRVEPYSTAETVNLEVQLLDRDKEPFDVILEDGASPNVRTWPIPAGMYERVSFRIKPARAAARVMCYGLDTPNTFVAPLLSCPMSYGDWTGHLPARGFLVLTRPPKAAEAGAPANTGATGGAATDEQTGNKAPPPVYAKWSLTLNPPLPSELDTGVLLASLALTVVVTLLAAIIIIGSQSSSLRAPVNNVSFDFGSSWGTNIAVGGSILTLLTGGTMLAREEYASNSMTYLLLASLFTLFVPLGATLYGLLQPGRAAGKPGHVIGYLLASAVVLWAAFGQLLLLGMFFRELELARVLAPIAAELLIWMSKGLIVFLIIYAVLTSKTIAADVPRGVAPAAVPMI